MEKTVSRKEIAKQYALAFVAAVMMFAAFTLVTNFAYAADAKTMIKAVVTIVRNILSVVGVIITLVGLTKFAIAHANDQGPEQKNAAMMMATGIVLVLLAATVIPNLGIENWVTEYK